MPLKRWTKICYIATPPGAIFILLARHFSFQLVLPRYFKRGWADMRHDIVTFWNAKLYPSGPGGTFRRAAPKYEFWSKPYLSPLIYSESTPLMSPERWPQKCQFTIWTSGHMRVRRVLLRGSTFGRRPEIRSKFENWPKPYICPLIYSEWTPYMLPDRWHEICRVSYVNNKSYDSSPSTFKRKYILERSRILVKSIKSAYANNSTCHFWRVPKSTPGFWIVERVLLRGSKVWLPQENGTDSSDPIRVPFY